MSVLLDQVVNCFNGCTTVPEEQYDYFTWIPLYQDENDIEWSDAGSEVEEERGKGVAVPRSRVMDLFIEHTGGGNTATAEQSVLVARKAGYAPSRADERALKERYGDAVTFGELEKWLDGVKHTEDTVSYLIEIFRKYDRERTGFLTKEQIQTILTKRGGEDCLTVDEFNAFARRTNITDKPINYEELCKQILE